MIIVAMLILMIFSINTTLLTGYTASLIELSKSMCRGSLYLEKVEWFYTDYIVIENRYVFAGPIGVSLILSPLACILDNKVEILFAGGFIMSLSIIISAVLFFYFLRELSSGRYALTSVLIAVLSSLPWIYSSHIFPQAILTMCYSALILYTQRILSSRDLNSLSIALHSLFSLIAFLSDPSTIILIIALSSIALTRLSYLVRRGILKRGRMILFIVEWLIIFSPALVFQAYYNASTTGSMIIFPEVLYSKERGLGSGFNLSLIPAGLVAQLIDPRKSLLSLYPASFISLIYLYRSLDLLEERLLKVSYVAMIIIPLIVYSSWHDFHGGLSYGPRFLTPVTVLLSLSVYYILNHGRTYEKILILSLSTYSVLENSIVLSSTPYPCAFQDLKLLENQFYTCSVRQLIENPGASLLSTLLRDLIESNSLANMISAGILFTLAMLIIFISFRERI